MSECRRLRGATPSYSRSCFSLKAFLQRWRAPVLSSSRLPPYSPRMPHSRTPAKDGGYRLSGVFFPEPIPSRLHRLEQILVACRLSLVLVLVLILLRLYVSSEYVRVRGSMKWRKCSRDFSSSPAMMLPLTRVHNRGQWRDSSSRRKQLLCTRCYLDEAGGMSSSLEAKKNQAGEKKSSSSSTTASGTYRRHFPFFPAMLACASILSVGHTGPETFYEQSLLRLFEDGDFHQLRKVLERGNKKWNEFEHSCLIRLNSVLQIRKVWKNPRERKRCDLLL